MVDYRYLLVDSSAGTNIAELPITVASFTRELNGVGQLSGTLPLDLPAATTANLVADREITVLRNDTPVWNGPITMYTASLATRSIDITAREASWHLVKRTLEINKNFNADLYYVVRAVVAYAIDKQSNGLTSGGSSINATIPRFHVSPASGNSGTTKAVRYLGSARHTIAEILDDLVADPTTGLDFRMDYATGSTRLSCSRTLTVGSPSLGSQRTHRLTEHNLFDFTKAMDWERGATRVHVLGNGYTATAQNTGSVTAGLILSESVFPRTDKANHTWLDNYARQARYLAQPPVSAYTAAFVPTVGGLEYGFCDLGDSVNIQVGGSTLLTSSGYRRVISIETTATDSAEVVTLTLNVPLDQLGT